MTTLQALESFKAQYGRFGRRFAGIRAGWTSLVLIAAVVAVDALFALSGAARLALVVGGAVALAVLVWTTLYLLRRSRSFDRMIARIVEDGDPRLENRLVNALDFRERLRDDERVPGAALMRAEIAQADLFARGASSESLRPGTYHAERIALAAIAGVCVVLAVAFWPVVTAVLPRLLLPFADLPPYSPTSFDVVPGTHRLHYGEDLKVTVKTSGKIPADVDLVLWDRRRGEFGDLPMFNAGSGEFFQTIENLRDDMRYFVRAARGRSKRYAISVIKEPRIETIIVEYVHPAYTRQEPETRTLANGAVRGYSGTEVALTIHSNRPLASGAIRVDGEAIELAKAAEGAVQGSFALSQAGTFTIDVADAEGNLAKAAARGTIEIIPDDTPEIVITAPGMDSFAVPDATVPIEISVVDDLGISQIALFRNHNESSDLRAMLYDADEGLGSLTVVERLELGRLGVRPGDIIEYYATAADNRPGTPQSAATPAYRLQIISHEEYRDYMQTQITAEDLREHYEAILEQLQELAARQRDITEQTEALEKKMANGSPSEEDLAALEDLQARQQQLADAAQAMAQDLRREADERAIFDIENSYKEALRDFANRLDEATGHMQSAQGQMAPPGSGVPTAVTEQRQAADKLDGVTQEFQNGIQQANEHLENVMKVIGDVEDFKYLYTLQKGLERQIRYYRQTANPTLDDEIRLKELSEQQDAVLKALSQLRQNLRDHADELDEFAREQDALEEPVP